MKGEQTLLNKIDSPEKLKELAQEKLPLLAEEIRERIIDVVMRNGGHLASNLGVVELTLALHRTFITPKDMIFWDVGHQCYTHKILTGRNDQFDTVRKKDGLSGFPKRDESDHDAMEAGHSSTSISAGVGALAGKRLLEDEGKVIAVIGDGALTAGMAYEGLNFAGHLGKDFIVVYNDNNMSISPNVGGLSLNSNLSKLSSYVSRAAATPFYQRIRERIDRKIRGIPILGYKLFELMVLLKRAIKAAFLKESLFTELGFDYVGPIDGHSISHMTSVFEDVKRMNGPVVVHVVTQKGKGYALAEEDPSGYHGISPVKNVDGKIEKVNPLTYTQTFALSLHRAAEKDKRVVAISAAMSQGTGLSNFQEHFPERFFDVGIAEQHAVTYAAGLALSGLKPVIAIYSTFMQRAVDQVIHDVALPGLPVIFAMDRSGMVGGDGETHQGLYDIPLFRSIPGISIVAPAGSGEMDLMLDWALTKSGPVMIRYPKDICPEQKNGDTPPIIEGRGAFVEENSGDMLLVSVGGLYSHAREAVNTLTREGMHVDLYNLRFIKPLDEEYLMDLFSRYSQVMLVEDGAEQGGVGEALSSAVLKKALKTNYRWYGVPDRFFSQADRDELIVLSGLDSVSIAEKAKKQFSSPFSVVRPAESSEII
ncbi:MAG: 1-deoxy-D-xylulose-5-phosphate synthase [Spirochaetia bacterium]